MWLLRFYCLALIVLIVLIILHAVYKDDRLDFDVDWTFSTTFAALYFIFAVTSYGVMIFTYLKSRSISTNRGQTKIRALRSSRFHVAFIIITSYFSLMTIPKLWIAVEAKLDEKIYTCHTINDMQKFNPLVIYFTLEGFSDLIDGTVYVFMYNPVRKMLGTLLARLRKSFQRPSEIRRLRVIGTAIAMPVSK